ncbi:MAG: cyclopropane-fatty-acyl-phospholipid synthase family protein [Gammaproteobacteria bacterium]
MLNLGIKLTEFGLIPECILRAAIKKLLLQRLREIPTDPEDRENQKQSFIQHLKQSPIALSTELANEQHYEVPPAFFQQIMGTYLKYSCGWFDEDTSSLDHAEANMLDLYIERLDIQNNQRILDLGCGWGSFTLYAASKFPNSQFVAVSNSNDQIDYINKTANTRSLTNVRAIKQNMNALSLEGSFDRIISIEMFEHMRNYGALLKKLRGHLLDHGKMFVHIFTHRNYPYPYEVRGPSDWMSKYFFTSGLMPSQDIFTHFTEDLIVERSWEVNGSHYAKTCNLWLQNHYKNKKNILAIFKEHYPNPQQWFVRWQLFFLACEELFAYNEGREWFVSHYLLVPKKESA